MNTTMSGISKSVAAIEVKQTESRRRAYSRMLDELPNVQIYCTVVEMARNVSYVDLVFVPLVVETQYTRGSKLHSSQD